ncbi:peroxiredoxin [Profundibacterium mesophilum]|uniref:Glutathione-dependent peroxiredoxin n=1 Tax=Profundibacterium mesophilum KAUST100406-0324 TaxID=1037889 RepID=A0A921NX68_9RHOB|nr:peroxiredoxin [Profundibacterium mesophilum]KAF0677313.1 peroxiredoxin 5 atypical 2-Cys peroxiredoxin [Profundibacterium mesophilum KAUST100406-0324]
MSLKQGDRLPDATLLAIDDEGPRQVSLNERLAGRKVVIFGLPGAFTPTCDSAHVPSFIRTRDAFAKKGVDEIICVAVNDPHVMRYWGKTSGAAEAGITMLSDADASFTKAIGMNFTAEAVGFYDRSMRYALYAEDGEVKVLHMEEARGVCERSGGEALLAAI